MSISQGTSSANVTAKVKQNQGRPERARTLFANQQPTVSLEMLAVVSPAFESRER